MGSGCVLCLHGICWRSGVREVCVMSIGFTYVSSPLQQQPTQQMVHTGIAAHTDTISYPRKNIPPVCLYVSPHNSMTSRKCDVCPGEQHIYTTSGNSRSVVVDINIYHLWELMKVSRIFGVLLLTSTYTPHLGVRSERKKGEHLTPVCRMLPFWVFYTRRPCCCCSTPTPP